MPMFDIQDSNDVKLTNNKTNDAVFLKGKNIDGLEASGNEALLIETKNHKHSWRRSVYGAFFNPISAAIIAAIVLGLIASYFTELKSILKYQ